MAKALFLLVTLALPAAVEAQAQPMRITNTSSIGSCFSPYVYNLIMNAANTGAAITRGFITNTTDKIAHDTAAGTISPNDFRIDLEIGNRTMSIITLFTILGVSILLLFAGEALVKTVTVAVSTLVSFMAFLYLWQWACSSTVPPMEGGVKCILPFVLACVCGLLVAILVIFLLRKFESFVYFAMGAAGGAVGMFMLRQFILAGNPSLGTEPMFNFYWLGLVVVAIICGVVAAYMRTVVVRLVTCVLGGYAFAIALCGLIPTFDGPYVPTYGFFITAFGMMVVGFVFQCLCCKKKPEDERAKQYAADRDARKKSQKNKKAVEMQRHDMQQFVAP